MTQLSFVVPDGIDDPRRPSGGNVYDQRAREGLSALGWSVHERGVSDDSSLAAALAQVPDGGLVLVDGLVASEALALVADRLRIVILLHMPRDDPGEAAALSAASAIVATSQWTRRWLRERHGLADRVSVVPPGTDAAELAPGSPTGGRLLCVGAITPVKGQDLLIDALGMVDDLAWCCDFVGALDVDAEFADGVLRRGGDLGDRVRFTGPLTDAGAAYTQADVLVVASRAETYGMVITEALARGLPVIAADVGGVGEAMGGAADGSTPGLLVAREDPAALAQALRLWLGNQRERERLRSAARSRRATLIDWAQTARMLSALLAKAVSKEATIGLPDP